MQFVINVGLLIILSDYPLSTHVWTWWVSLKIESVITESSSSASFPTSKWCRCCLWFASISPDNSLSDRSFLMLSTDLRFYVPLIQFPGTSITSTILPTYSSSLPNTTHTTSTYFPVLSWIFLFRIRIRRQNPYSSVLNVQQTEVQSSTLGRT